MRTINIELLDTLFRWTPACQRPWSSSMDDRKW